MLDDVIHSSIGGFHTLTAVLAMIAGLVVVFNKKGTVFHKRIGYFYVINMLLLNLSSFFIINFGGFSIFHFFALLSLATIIGGMVPALRRTKNWYGYHFYFMSWSVVGLYCAFWSEVGTRFVKNMQEFWWAVALASIATALIGNYYINREAKKLNLKK